MTLAEINEKITKRTGQDTTSYPNSERAIDLNIVMHKMEAMIFDSQDNSDFDDLRHGDYPSFTAPLVSLQRDYPIAQDEFIVNLKRVNVSYDGVNYYKAEPIDSSDFMRGLAPSEAETYNTQLDADFTKTNPRYDFTWGSLFLYPRANASDVASGAKLYVEWSRAMRDITASELSAGTIVPSFDPTYHGMVAIGTALEFFMDNKMFDDADRTKVEWLEYEQMLRKQYGKKQQETGLQLQAYPTNYK